MIALKKGQDIILDVKGNSLIKFLFYLFFLYLNGIAAKAQGPYLGAMVTPAGTSIIGGASVLGIAEVGAVYQPQWNKKTNVGYIGGTGKLPLRYRIIKEDYSGSLIFGLYATSNLGSIKIPIPEYSDEKKSKSSLGWSLSMGGEFMLFKSGIIISLPIELGIGKMHFNQAFDEQNVQLSSDYTLRTTLIMNVGLRMFLFRTNCEEYISNLY